jgi:alpha-tubulin suppressor-like RCC1 family protein
VVTGVKPGTTTVLAQSGSKIGTVTITVVSAFNLRDQTLVTGGDSWQGSYTCAIAQNQMAYCWGRNSHGQLGDGSQMDRLEPVEVAGGIRFSMLTAGRTWTCGIDTDQQAYCWGGGYNGVLGDGSNYQARYFPGLVGGGKRWLSLSAGGSHVCGIATDNQAYCWGTNYYGQLGNGKSGDGQGGTSVDELQPKAIVLSKSVRQIVAHQVGTCAITVDGETYCWGYNGNGELGIGSTSGNTGNGTPQKVLGGYVFESITAGGQSICGQVASGTIYCWGANSGQLSSSFNSAVPQPVLFGGIDIRALSLGISNHACGIAANGKAYCWGNNAWGKLGVVSPASSQNPIELSLGSSVSIITSGADHSCAILQAGELKCWGANINGERGDGTTSSKSVPTEIVGGQQFTTVSLTYSSSCALDTSSKAWCWGGPGWTFDNSGTEAVIAPVAIAGGLSFVEIVNADYAKCGRTSGGQVWCWGAGWDGQRGDGTNNTSPNPSRVNLTDVVTQISGGQSHICALTSAGAVYCWGRNSEGQLGDNSTVNRNLPVRVAGTFSHVAAGGQHSCALTADGSAVCWGWNQNGQLGNGSNDRKLLPVAVAGNLKFSRLSLGWNYSCGIGLLPAGKVYCWGDNNFGKLGTGSNNSQFLAPIAVNSTLTFDRLSTPLGENMCARSTAGEWYCSGRADWGLFGAGIPLNSNVQNPTRIGGDPGLNELSLGQEHACGVRTATKQTYCWGKNTLGKLTATFSAASSVKGSIVFRGSR